jgi:hypothetical protein
LQPSKAFAITGKSPTGVDYYDAGVVQFADGATGSLSGASTVPKHCGNQIDMRLFGSEGMLLLDLAAARFGKERRGRRQWCSSSRTPRTATARPFRPSWTN